MTIQVDISYSWPITIKKKYETQFSTNPMLNDEMFFLKKNPNQKKM